MRIRSFAGILATCVLAICAAPAWSNAATVTPAKPAKPAKPVKSAKSAKPSPATLAPGRPAVLQSSVIPGHWCRLELTHRGAPSSETAPQRATSALIEYQWKVPKRVAPGAWTGRIACGLTRAGLLHGRVTQAHVVMLRVARRGRFHGAAAADIRVIFPHSDKVPTTTTGKGGGTYPPLGRVMIPAGAWLDGSGVTVFSNGYDGNPNGPYQCVELVNRLIATLHWSPAIWGNANQIYGDASSSYFDKYPNGSGYRPVPGDIVVWGGGEGGWGHVAVVDAISGSLLTVVEQNASPSGYDTYDISSSGYIPPRYGYHVEGFLHAKANHLAAPAPPPPPPPSTTTPTAPQTTYAETAGGATDTWSDYADAGGSQGPSLAANQTVRVACRTAGFTVADGNSWWYLIASSPWSDNYYASADAFYNNGQTSGSLQGTPFFDPNVPLCSGAKSAPPTPTVTEPSVTTSTTAPPPAPSTTTSTTSSPVTTTAAPPPVYNETVGGVTHTWTDYVDAGGTEGPSIAAYQTVQVACAVQGFRVGDGNTWWYKLASSPWNGSYYASADAFYNNGQTSGSLLNTPFVDPRVPVC